MPKNKGKYRSKDTETEPLPDAEELKSLTARALIFMRPHAIKIAAILGGVAVVLIAFSVWSWYDQRREAAATRLFGEAAADLQRPVMPSDPANPLPPPEPGEPPRFNSVQERANAALAKLDQIEQQHGGADVAAHARLVRAGVLYDLGRYDEAIAAWKRYLESADTPELRFAALEGIGYAQEAKALAATDPQAKAAGLGEALQTFEGLQPDEKGYYRDYALYHQARIKAEKGDREGALKTYKDILDKFPASPLRVDVNNRVALLEG